MAVASRLLGANAVYACDIDLVAGIVAKANIERNAEDKVWTFCGSVDAIGTGTMGLVLCNLTADLIVELFGELDRVLRSRGIAILSGILRDQHEDIREVMSRYQYSVHEEGMRGEWLAIVAEKHGA